MKNNIKKEATIAQVGFTFEDISLTGIQYHGQNQMIEIPRIVIMEKPKKTNKYDEFHVYYKEQMEEIIEKLGERARLLQLFRGDIYDPSSLADLPPIAFLVLENVLSDPFYRGEKNFHQLIKLMKEVMIKDGVILTLDSRLGFSNKVMDLVKNFQQVALNSGDFTTLLNLLEVGYGLENIQKRDSKLPVQIITTELEKLYLIDEALKEGLSTLRLGIYHCLVLQKK